MQNEDSKLYLSGSDDYDIHRTKFERAFRVMIDDKIATPEDFIHNAGFARTATDDHIYFIYVGTGTHVKECFYLNVNTGAISTRKGSL